MLVLMHDPGRVERFDLKSGRHLGTLISGLPPANELLLDADGRLLISTGAPGGSGNLLRFDPRGAGRVETMLDIPDGYGGRLFRGTGMAWFNGDLLVASQGDGKVKRYSYPACEWIADVALATPGAMTQIAIHDGRLFVTDYAGQSIRRASEKLDGSMSEVWAQFAAQSPWGLVFAGDGNAFWSTSASRIHRSNGTETIEWAGVGGGLGVPIGLAIGPDGLLYTANLGGSILAWKTTEPNTGAPVRLIQGPELKSPISIAFTTKLRESEFVYTPPNDQLKESAEKLAFFESKIRPLLHARCIECHGKDQQEGNLRLDSKLGWEKGGELGTVIRPGEPDASLLMKAVSHTDKDLKMPPDKPLNADEIKLLTDWVRQGAVDPRTETDQASGAIGDSWADEFQKRLDWWSLKPLSNAEPPMISDVRGSKHNVDRFIAAGLEKAGLQPGPTAAPEVLLRRLCFVLTGLPPTPWQRENFLKHWQTDSAAAYETLVDTLLASPQFGERFARHWMDVVRYTDTYGYEWDVPAKGSHEYRDYLIRVFNQDVGYDTFLREQLAGDLVQPPRVNQELGINESLIGPMFYHMGEHRHGSSLAYNGIHQEMINNKVDAFSKAFLATTVACAKCHDHKLEAVSQKDYYALGAMFMMPRWASRPVDAPGKNTVAIERLKTLRNEIRDEVAKEWTAAVVNGALSGSAWRELAKPLASTSTQPTSASPLPTPPAPTPPTIEDIVYPLTKLDVPDADVVTVWNALAEEWRNNRTARLKAKENFSVLADFSEPRIPVGWVTDGEGMEHGWVEDATPLIALEGDQVVTKLLPRGYNTHAISSKLPGVLRMPPQHELQGQFVSLELAGGEYAGYLQLDANSILNEAVTVLPAKPSWRSIGDAVLKGGVSKVTFDFATASLNPNFPARVGIITGLPNQDLGYDKRSWLSITGIVSHETAGAPQSTLDSFDSLYGQTPPQSVSELDATVGRWFAGAVTRWCDGKAITGDRQIVDWLLGKQKLPNQAPAGSKLEKLLAEYRAVEKTIEFPRTINSMDEREVNRAGLHLNIRGNYDALGEVVMPGSLAMFAGRDELTDSIAKSSGSGRMELAESLLEPEHPLTSRVYANRLWAWVFGAGIVTTPDDFGRLGDRPAHPELLDWLARELVRQGWSTKKIVRQLVMSEAFRQSGQVSELAKQRDPANRLLHHFATRRMEAEVIRDSLLAVSGRLDKQLYGRPINPNRPAEDATKRLYSGPVDGGGRRSLYLTSSIMAPSKFLMTFDLPDLKLPSGKRNVTSVPTQSLQMLNDPLVQALAEHWATSLLREPHKTPNERIHAMHITAFGREPSLDEQARWAGLLSNISTSSDPMNDVAAWTQLAHTMFNAKEFIFFR